MMQGKIESRVSFEVDQISIWASPLGSSVRDFLGGAAMSIQSIVPEGDIAKPAGVSGFHVTFVVGWFFVCFSVSSNTWCARHRA